MFPTFSLSVFWGACILGVLLGLFLHAYTQPYVQVVYAAETQQKPREVRLEVKIDWTEDRIEKAIREAFPENPDLAVAVAMAESRMNPKALNPEAHNGCTGSRGVFQIACVHMINDTEALYDPAVNIQKAREIYLAQGWQPWGAYTDGNYKRFY